MGNVPQVNLLSVRLYLCRRCEEPRRRVSSMDCTHCYCQQLSEHKAQKGSQSRFPVEAHLCWMRWHVRTPDAGPDKSQKMSQQNSHELIQHVDSVT